MEVCIYTKSYVTPTTIMYNPAKTEEEQYAEYELSDIEIQQLKEHNQKRVKRVVAVVAILLTVISLGLVAFSLALGKKIDLMVEETMRRNAEEEYRRTGVNITENHG
ncbi:unnamed protein product [Auanema sp. JU1783]|nr:unnamed protein product [Auanema sp. JU1783]